MRPIVVKLAQKNNNQKVSDLFKILDTENYFFSNIKDINKYIRDKECYIAVQDKKIVGALILELEEQSYKIHMIRSKQKGGGKVLIDFAVKKCKQKNVPKLWSWSLVRYKAKNFYRKMGFKEMFLLKKQWYGEDCYFFGREIKSDTPAKGGGLMSRVASKAIDPTG